ncbi:hypothetical protein [Candidatus Hamiltonella endosymbiont of Tuberolachnus salignus]|uniref:hypothetical protein n=1 Tax=Candidatus Williamhamiltonella endosymbiont of Tuberolachnus salignus TaxID=3077954 RepID=UPI0030D39801
MGEQFDFDLVANDDASKQIDRIIRSVQSLYPPLDKLKGGLKPGGQDTLNGLDSITGQFKGLNTFAKEGVQLIGDMVSPLKMVGGLSLGIGAAAAGMYKTVTGMREAGKSAQELSTSAQNAGLSVEKFTQLSGAMQILGMDADAAKQSVEGLYGVFNDALQGRSHDTLSLLNQIGAQIAKNDDGTADLTGTMRHLSRVFPALSSQNQKKVSDRLGLDANSLKLLRTGNFDELMSQSKDFGLTVPDGLNDDLTGINGAINEMGAAWDGLKQKTRGGFYSLLLSDGSVKDGMEGITDILTHGPDNVALMHALGVTRGDESQQLRKGYNDPEFYKTLTITEKTAMDFGVMTDGLREKFQAYYGPKEMANQLASDLAVALQRSNSTGVNSYQGVNIGQPSAGVNPRARSVRNNNPWNMNYARQQGAVMEPGAGGSARFAKFETPEVGIAAADRQLMLYYTGQSKAARNRPLTTIEQIISTASPLSDGNNTRAMISGASRELGVKPGDQLNLTDPALRARVLTALFNQEGNNPWSSEQVQSVISGAPVSQVQNRTENNNVSNTSTVNNNSKSSTSTVNNSKSQDHSQGIAEAVREGLSNTKVDRTWGKSGPFHRIPV